MSDVADRQPAPSNDDDADWIMLGQHCTWQGAFSETMEAAPRAEMIAARRERRPINPATVVAVCPHCHMPVGRAERAMWDSKVAEWAAKMEVEPEMFCDMMKWQPPRCFPSPRDKARAYLAQQRRDARAARRRGLH